MAAEVVGGAFLSSFLDVVFDRLSSTEVVKLIRGKKLNKKLIQRLETTLYVVQAVLSDAEQKQITDPAVKKWLVNLEDAVYEADDLLDEVSTKAATQKDEGKFWSRYLMFNLKGRKMVTKIEEVIDTLEAIAKHKDILGLEKVAMESTSWRIPSTSLVEKSDIFGRDEDKEVIIKLLLDDTCDTDISVISLVGMGGVGKTTLAQLVYNDDKLKGKFDYKAWVCVAENFDVLNVTRAVIEAITSSSCDMNDLNLLQIDLKQKVTEKTFLIVLDDVWDDCLDKWNALLKPFQYGSKGSRILVTTRNERVASVMPSIPPYKLSLLSDEDCWSVFLKHAFLSTKSREYIALEQIGRNIVKKCKGLPLAVEALGSLLRTKCDLRDWNDILKSEIWEFSKGESRIIPALRISYHYLPSHLKRCFVYCSLFPKDYLFDKDELILLWMAEDLLQPRGRKTLEEIGGLYFTELFVRSFFQPFGTSDRYFVMHNLIHDLATFCAGEFYFRVEEFGDAANISIKNRHLSHNARGNYSISQLLAACDKVKHMRTFLAIDLHRSELLNMENTPCILLSQLKYIRVLSFESLPLDHDSLSYSIGELIHLRYLDLSYTPIMMLPESLRNLYNLQTLKLKGCHRLKMLPSGMQDLVNLRHLNIRGTRLEKMPKGMSKLEHLQVLSDFVIGKHEENGIRELGGLSNLHGSLRITKLENLITSEEAVEARIDDKKHINILELQWSSDGDIANFQIERDILDKLRPHRELKELLIMNYKGIIFPDWLGHSSYHNIIRLTLYGCRNCYMLPSLGQLPSLKHLSISQFNRLESIGAEFYKNDESYCETPFSSLETLEFDEMPYWQEWHSFEFDAFPQLKHLIIYHCPRLKGDLPDHLSALETLNIEQCSSTISFPGSCMPPSLQKLEITKCKKLEFPLQQQQHKSLQSIEIQNSCDSLSFFPLEVFPNLMKLYIWGCEGMKYLVSQSQDMALSSLRDLTISHCPGFASFSTLGMAASQLERLEIEHCPKVYLFDEWGLPPNLRELYIRGCHKLVRWLASTDFHSHNLTHLEIYGACDSVKSFPKEGCLPTYLQSLELWDFPSLETLDCNAIHHLTSLQKLTIGDCSKLENMTGERLPASLKGLFISNSPLLGERCEMKDIQIWPKISHIPGIYVDGKRIL